MYVRTGIGSHTCNSNHSPSGQGSVSCATLDYHLPAVCHSTLLSLLVLPKARKMSDSPTSERVENTVQKVGPPTVKIPEMQILNDGEDLFSHSPYEVRVFKKRWIALAVYFLHITFINWMWFSYSAIPDIITCYYRVNVVWVNALSWVIMAVYVVGVVPAMWILEHVNLKLIAIVGGLLNALGAWLRFAGTSKLLTMMEKRGKVCSSHESMFLTLLLSSPHC